MDSQNLAGLLLGLGMFVFVIAIAFYVYFSWAFMSIAKKLNLSHAWWAWIPILNLFLFLDMADLSYWWFLALIIPYVNIVVMIWMWIRILERLNYSPWMVILLLLPLVNIIFIGVLAWSKSKVENLASASVSVENDPMQASEENNNDNQANTL